MLAYPHHERPAKAKPKPAMISIKLKEYNKLKRDNAALVEALKEAETTLRWAVQEAKGKVKKEIVGGWAHHANKAKAALDAAEGGV